MQEVPLADGKILHMPEAVQRSMISDCECHRRLGAYFAFLPVGQCIRLDKKCDAQEKRDGAQ